MDEISSATRGVPAWLKWGFTAFVAVLVPVYLTHYGPANFLYFCDLALLLTLAGMWTGKPLFFSMAAVGILVPQAIWVADFAGNLLFGVHLLGMTDYMFDAHKPLFLRALSLFHGWLPFLLLYLIWRLGYDRRAFLAWTALGTAVLLVCYLVMPGPTPDAGNAAVNINYVFGMSDAAPQTWMPPLAWFALLLAGLPLAFFLPVHLVLSRWRSGAVAVT
jgi:hypothetical protein